MRAPEEADGELIVNNVKSKNYWIYRRAAEWRDLNATRVLRKFKNGEGFLYLGRSYRLLLVSEQEQPLRLKNAVSCCAVTSSNPET